MFTFILRELIDYYFVKSKEADVNRRNKVSIFGLIFILLFTACFLAQTDFDKHIVHSAGAPVPALSPELGGLHLEEM
jgi:hypothetical protein